MKSRNKLVVLLLSLSSCFAAQAADPNWSVQATDYEYSMNITGAYYVECNYSGTLNDQIGAFVGDELRGVGMISEENLEFNLVYLTIFSNTASGESISFKYYDPIKDMLLDLALTVEFVESSILGSRSKPYALYESEAPISPIIALEGITFKLDKVEDYYETYQWYLNDEMIIGENESVLIAQYNGDMKLQITTKNGCSDYSNVINFSGGVILGTTEGVVSISVYPNPTSRIAVVESSLLSDLNAKVQIIDLLGRRVYGRMNRTGDYQISIDLSFLHAGVYTVLVETNKKVFKEALVKK